MTVHKPPTIDELEEDAQKNPSHRPYCPSWNHFMELVSRVKELEREAELEENYRLEQSEK